MASRILLIIMICVSAAVIVPCLGAEYMVGDDVGWRLGVDYSRWAQGKDFRVGDTLVFKYYPGAHNVIEVNESDLGKCASSNVSTVPFTSGIDVVHLTTSGKKGYICSVGEHCSAGMKLGITVSDPLSAPFPSLSSPSSSAANDVSALKSCVWMIVLMAAFKMRINVHDFNSSSEEVCFFIRILGDLFF
ncbi:hypothetical protein CASFOL_036941 [Castilleja foliolosa]|uniref:Phytocyanin domain-containing protein n=1 Tax=Castilleja foliolosa TaxID=1961234 RepID=A0ABD3BPE9_9LAMI